MAFDWTTFGLEIINFLALLWILKRFLYRPVLATLAQRQARIEGTLNEARETEAKASGLKTQFESRLADWEQERKAARARFEAELAAERIRQTESLGRELEAERERDAAKEAHRQETLKHELTIQARNEARQFASALLASLAGPDLEHRLIELFVAELAGLPEERLVPLRSGQNGDERVVVSTAFSQSDEQRLALSNAIESRIGVHGPMEFVQDGGLLAGVRLSLGSWQLDLSLAGELGIFAEACHLA